MNEICGNTQTVELRELGARELGVRELGVQ